ncbi:helix-turn-helix transcriptional regulator [Pseudochrobactrum sp. HB0163]|uniref:helix-turn-helix transcriptional regulator n=1 Tax=Pseudochrobactrum sp. HB0163 TaxID=3450708 RepID=UPI003F6DDB42
MELELIHFPDFQNSFFGKEYCSTILETCCAVRERLSCKHITHISPKLTEGDVGSETLKTVVSTAPADWVVHYAAKNYFDIDPLFHQSWSDAQDDRKISITEIYEEEQSVPALQSFVNDIRAHKFADLFALVTQNLNSHGVAYSIFGFDSPRNHNHNKPMHADDLIRLLEKDLQWAAMQLQNAVVAETNTHAGHKKDVQALVALTPREVDCLKWAARGKTDGEIAEILNIARWTVVTYLQNAKIKLGCANRTSAVAVAMSLGIIPLPDTSHLQG